MKEKIIITKCFQLQLFVCFFHNKSKQNVSPKNNFYETSLSTTSLCLYYEIVLLKDSLTNTLRTSEGGISRIKYQNRDIAKNFQIVVVVRPGLWKEKRGERRVERL